MVRHEAPQIVPSALPATPSLIMLKHDAAPPTAYGRQRMIGAALLVDGGHFVTQDPFRKQKNSRTDAAAMAAEPFWVPFIVSPPVCPACACDAAKTLADAAPLLTTVTSMPCFAGGSTHESPTVAATEICACIAVIGVADACPPPACAVIPVCVANV